MTSTGAGRAELAGEPDRADGANPIQHPLLVFARRRHRMAGREPVPGRSSIALVRRRSRHAGCGRDGSPPARSCPADVDRLPVRIGDAYRAATAQPQPARDMAEQHSRERDDKETQLITSPMRSEPAAASGSGGLAPVEAAADQPGICAAAATSRPAWTIPSQANSGTSTATISAIPRSLPYHGRTRSQKCRPSIAWPQATNRTSCCNTPRSGACTK